MDDNSTSTQPTEAPQTNSAPASQEQASSAPAQTPNLHGFTEEQLADMAKFYSNNGGYEKVKSLLSNRQQPNQQSQRTQSTQSPQPVQPTQGAQSQDSVSTTAEPARPAPTPEGFASPRQLFVKQYFDSISRDPKYANIAESIQGGEVLKEMATMGMHPIDEDYNINIEQLTHFLDLKAASVPAKPSSVEPTNIPTVQYYDEGKPITTSQQALAILQQSFELQARGLTPHPDAEKAREFLRQTGPNTQK